MYNYRIKRIKKQLFALVKRNILIESRYKLNYLNNIMNPILQLVISLLIFGVLFNIKSDYKLGYWDSSNYAVFLLLGFNIQFFRKIINEFYRIFLFEKYWKTLQAILLAPINRIILLFSIIISELIQIIIPISIIFIISLLILPISIINFILILLLFFAIAIVFGSIGLILGAYAISNENIASILKTFLRILFIFSCVIYPIDIFPDIIKIIIYINPLFYFFDSVRLLWLMGFNFELAINYFTLTHLFIIIFFTILAPIIALLIFNKVYNKYGITGY
ncbi:MAG: ABC transporter permease [Promethearchaeota archaeon]